MIRSVLPSDYETVSVCIRAAFQRDAEVRLVHQLRAEEDVLLELIAELKGKAIGHAMVSKLRLTPEVGLYCGGVAPVSVLPEYQFQGIGSGLMQALIQESGSLGLDALFLLGDPAYYERFGFRPSQVSSDYPAAYFQDYELTRNCLLGISAKALYANAFISL